MDCIEPGSSTALATRHLTQETCEKFGYTCSFHNGQPVQVAPYRDQAGTVVAQKLRFANKVFTVAGNLKGVQLFGQHLWPSSGKKIVVTEGEIDALSVSQMQGNKWPVVSVPNGAQGAKKALETNLEWLCGYDEVVLMFDNDEPGKEAAQECAALFPPGKCKIATLPLKDPNELLVAGRGNEIITAMWNAKEWRPDGIVAGVDLWDKITKTQDIPSINLPWSSIQKATKGLRRKELWVICAGTGIGKSTLARELAYHLITGPKETIGYLGLEEAVERTAMSLMSIHLNTPLHVSGTKNVAEAALKESFTATVGSGRVFLYDHFGSNDIATLMSKIRFLARGCGCRWIFLDHVSIVVSGLGDGDERRLIDNLMTSLRSLVAELDIGMVVVSHLKRPEGKGHEEGAETSMAQLRGSAAIGQLADIVLGLERDQQGGDPNKLHVRVLKNRFTGWTGSCQELQYTEETGRLLPVVTNPFATSTEASTTPKDPF